MCWGEIDARHLPPLAGRSFIAATQRRSSASPPNGQSAALAVAASLQRAGLRGRHQRGIPPPAALAAAASSQYAEVQVVAEHRAPSATLAAAASSQLRRVCGAADRSGAFCRPRRGSRTIAAYVAWQPAATTPVAASSQLPHRLDAVRVHAVVHHDTGASFTATRLRCHQERGYQRRPSPCRCWLHRNCRPAGSSGAPEPSHVLIPSPQLQLGYSLVAVLVPPAEPGQNGMRVVNGLHCRLNGPSHPAQVDDHGCQLHGSNVSSCASSCPASESGVVGAPCGVDPTARRPPAGATAPSTRCGVACRRAASPAACVGRRRVTPRSFRVATWSRARTPKERILVRCYQLNSRS